MHGVGFFPHRRRQWGLGKVWNEERTAVQLGWGWG